MRLGLGSYTFGWAVGVPGFPPVRPLEEMGLLDWAHTLGVSVVQIADNLPLHTFESTRLERLTDRAKAEAITLEVGARRLDRNCLAIYIDIAHRVDASFIRWIVDDTDFHPDAEIVIATLKEMLPLLGDITLGIENHDRFSAHALQAIVEGVGDPRVGICLDTANSLGAGEGIEAVADALAPCTLNLHIKDVSIERLPHKMGFHIEGRPAGSGQLDIPAIVNRMAMFPNCRTAIAELWTPPESTLDATLKKEAEWAVQSIAYLKSLMPWE